MLDTFFQTAEAVIPEIQSPQLRHPREDSRGIHIVCKTTAGTETDPGCNFQQRVPVSGAWPLIEDHTFLPIRAETRPSHLHTKEDRPAMRPHQFLQYCIWYGRDGTEVANFATCTGQDHTPCVEGMGLPLHTQRLLRNSRKRGSRVVCSRCSMKSISEDAILDTIALWEKSGHSGVLTHRHNCGSRVVLNHLYHHFLRIQTHPHLQTHTHTHTLTCHYLVSTL